MCKTFSWSELYARRRAIAARFGDVYALPLVKRVRDTLLDATRDGARVLEVGAGEKRMGQHLRAARRDVLYETVDPDPRGAHDYRALDEVTPTYDVVCAFEVVEHLPLEEIGSWLKQLHARLAPGGRLLLSTPNTFYPPAYLRDATHRTPLCYDELGGLVEGAGFRVERLLRVYHDPVHRALLRRWLFGWLFRLLGLDFARQIVLVAVRPE